jgi:NADH-quinone oxidoreductase subunit A
MDTVCQTGVWWPLALYFVIVTGLVVGIVAISYALGERSHGRFKEDVYESGIVPTGSARLRMSAHFYLMAMFFVVFDLETAFLFAWAVSFRQTIPYGFWVGLFFILTLIIALVYLWKEGALDWGPSTRQHAEQLKKEGEE